MSVLVAVGDEEERVVPIGTDATVAALLRRMRYTLALPHPPSAYEVWLGAPGEGVDLGSQGGAALADVGIHGCEERLAVRVKFADVAQLQLKAEGIATRAQAAAALAAALRDTGVGDRAQLILAAGLCPLAPHIAGAMQSGRLDEARALLETDAAARIPRSELNDLLVPAVDLDASAIVARLLHCGADPNTRDDDSGLTPLVTACDVDNVEIARVLIAHGADVNCTDDDDRSPLAIAVEWGRSGMTDLLAGSGADLAADPHRHVLHTACERGDADVVRVLVRHGADVHARRDDRTTPLWLAVDRGSSELVGLLLRHGADANAVHDRGLRPLHRVAVLGNNVVLGLLLQHGADVNARAKNGDTALFTACSYEHWSIVETLMAHGADINASTAGGWTPLHYACSTTRPRDVVERLIRLGADVALADINGMTPLDYVVLRGSKTADVASLLLDRGAVVTEGSQVTTLHRACTNNAVDDVALLLEHGADVNARHPDGATPVIMACAQGNAALARLLLENGADVNVRHADDDTTPLYIACERADSELVKAILDGGADVDRCYFDNRSAVYVASDAGSREVVRLLLERGARVDDRRHDGRSALYEACDRGRVGLAELLLDHGADVGVRHEAHGFTTLHRACLNNNARMAALLLARGADVDAHDAGGRTALDCVTQRRSGGCNEELLKLLVDHGAAAGTHSEER